MSLWNITQHNTIKQKLNNQNEYMEYLRNFKKHLKMEYLKHRNKELKRYFTKQILLLFLIFE